MSHIDWRIWRSDDEDSARTYAEHVYSTIDEPHRAAFALLWNRINGKRAPWASNPWIWVVSFRRAT